MDEENSVESYKKSFNKKVIFRVLLGIIVISIIAYSFWYTYTARGCSQVIDSWNGNSFSRSLCYSEKAHNSALGCERVLTFDEEYADRNKLYTECLSLEAIERRDVSFCAKQKDFVIEPCITEYAIFYKDPQSCYYKNILLGDYKSRYTSFTWCYTNAYGNLTEEICDNIPQEDEKLECFYWVATKMEDNCEQILEFKTDLDKNFTPYFARWGDELINLHGEAYECKKRLAVKTQVENCLKCLPGDPNCESFQEGCLWYFAVVRGEPFSCFFQDILMKYNGPYAYPEYYDCFITSATSAAGDYRPFSQWVTELEVKCDSFDSDEKISECKRGLKLIKENYGLI